MSRRRFVAMALGAALLAGCASSSLVMLPNADGSRGQVTITKRGAATPSAVVTAANSRASLNGTPNVRPLGARGLKPAEAALVGSLPPPARSFTFYFLEGTTDMTPASLPLVEALRAEIAGRPGAEVQVTGHTDTVGNNGDNDALSRRRAEEIRRLLVSKGFDPRLMSAVGRGERELKVRTADNVASAANRRVEVIVR